jgi:hypothetical protein
MAHNSSSNRRRDAPSRASPDDPYCEFKDDRKPSLLSVTENFLLPFGVNGSNRGPSAGSPGYRGACS